MAYKNKLKIAVSGAAQAHICSPEAADLAKEIGREIARQGCILITGATTGIPNYAATGNREVKGISIGFSPATTEASHIKKYKLPTDNYDVIVYTGFGYAGRNLIMTRAADGIIVICGRMGTLNEFTIAFEDEKPIGVMLGSGGVADDIKDIVRRPFRGNVNIVYSKNPKELVKKLIQLIKKGKGRS
jgi:hypothetical protein